MIQDFSYKFPSKLITIGYKSNEEYLYDNIKQVEMLIDNYFSYITRSNKHNTKEDLTKKDQNDIKKQYLLAGFYISSRIGYTRIKDVFLPLYKIKQKFDLNNLEWTCLIMSIIAETSSKYRKIFSEINERHNDLCLTYELIMKVFYCVDSISDIEDFYNKFIELKFKMSSLFFIKDTVQIDKNVFYFLTSGDTKIAIKGTEIYSPDINNGGVLPAREEVAQKISKVLSLEREEQQFCFYLYGQSGIGKKTIVKRASELIIKSTVIIDLNSYINLVPEKFYKDIYTPLREAIIIDATICFDHFEVFDDMDTKKREYMTFLLDTAPKFSREVFILSKTRNSIPGNNEYISIIDVQIDNLNHKERRAIWNKYLEEINEIVKVNVDDISNKFNFTPEQIKATIEKAKSTWYWKNQEPLTEADMYKCAYSQSISKISDKAVLIKSKHTWDELILADNEKNMIRDACDQIKYKHIVFDKWGMNSRVVYGRGLSMLFAGPPGTGKTMAAQVAANELNLEVYKIDLSKIVSKYIGETEKNLDDLFNEAQKSNVILFFDETDALLGKRTEVKDSHDKNANLETSYILQKIEEYEGITIMTTNYIENIDKAFFRRISYVVHFPFPDEKSRKKIWVNMFPKQMPIEAQVDFDFLAGKFEISGGNIKNIAINSAFMAARNSTDIKMSHILKAIKYELKKQGKSLINDDFGEYAYLI